MHTTIPTKYEFNTTLFSAVMKFQKLWTLIISKLVLWHLSTSIYAWTSTILEGKIFQPIFFYNHIDSSSLQLLILENGAYGKRMGQIAQVLGVQYEVVSFPENNMVSIATVKEVLARESWTNVAIVHCETSSGVINPVVEVGKLVKQHLPGKKGVFVYVCWVHGEKLEELNCGSKQQGAVFSYDV